MREGKPRRVENGWQIRVTDEHGKRRKRTFETYADANKALTAEKARVADVKDGLRDPEPFDHTFDELADDHVRHRAPQKRSGHHDESIIRHHLRPAFGPMKLRDIGVQAIDKFRNDRAHLSPKTLSNILTLFITMLNRAVELGWLRKTPKIKKPKIDPADEDYDYLRSEDEVRRFLVAAEAEGELVYVMYATALTTGMRAGELAGLRWSSVNFAERLITVKFSYDGPPKSGKNRHVPILDPLLPLLKQWRLKCPGEFVFPNQNGGMHRESARVFQEVFHRVLDSAGFPKTEENGRLRRYIVFHDLRHTFASHWMMKRGDVFTLRKILGHKDISMTMRYAHHAPEAFASDHGRLGASLPGAADVLPLQTTVSS